MKLSIIVPVYNEGKTIKTVLETLLSLDLPCKKELIVVDDGSDDSTKTQITKFKSKNPEPNIKFYCHLVNQGKGAAIKTGIKYITGDYILIQDADLEYNPEEIPNLLRPIFIKPKTNNLKLTADIAVYGTRFKNTANEISLLYLLGNRFLTFITNIMYRQHLTDMETGYKLIPAWILKKINLTSQRFDIEPEITIQLIKHQIPIVEIPITYKGRSHLLGKKITFIDAFSAIKKIITMALR